MNYLLPFPDETLYGIFARTSILNGIYDYRKAKNIFVSKRVFSNTFTKKEARALAEHFARVYDSSLEGILQKHTYEPIKRLFRDNNRNINGLITVLCTYTQFLRVCTLCAKEDIKVYGTPYWHRSHQYDGIEHCHRHGTRLITQRLGDHSNSLIGLPSLDGRPEYCNQMSYGIPFDESHLIHDEFWHNKKKTYSKVVYDILNRDIDNLYIEDILCRYLYDLVEHDIFSIVIFKSGRFYFNPKINYVSSKLKKKAQLSREESNQYEIEKKLNSTIVYLHKYICHRSYHQIKYFYDLTNHIEIICYLYGCVDTLITKCKEFKEHCMYERYYRIVVNGLV